MSNPAADLADLLRKWRKIPEGASAVMHRGGSSNADRDLEFWRSHARAVELLQQIERLLAARQAATGKTSAWSGALLPWYKAVFSFPSWTETARGRRGELISASDFRDLETLRDHLDETDYADSVDSVSPDRDKLVEQLKVVDELVRATSELSQRDRRYLLGLVSEALRLLDEIETFGWSQARRVVFELGGAMQAEAVSLLTVQNKPEKAGKWLATSLATVALAGVAGYTGGLGQELGEQLGPHLLELTSGEQVAPDARPDPRPEPSGDEQGGAQ